jgi:dipeptidyl aminopeptidase/acylaminoacyl peptidase
MMFRTFLISATMLFGSAAAAQPKPAALFGARPAVEHMDLSPDGKSVVYVSPGPNAMQVIYVADLETGATKAVAKSSGDPERISSCNFASNSRLICYLWGLTKLEGELIPFSRLTTLNRDGSDSKLLGQRSSEFDTRLRQFSGSILDWLGGNSGAVLMTADYIPEGKIGTHIIRQRDGLGVDRIDLQTLKSSRVEPPRRGASAYMSDGNGNVRIMEVETVAGANQQLQGVSKYMYRRTGPRDWEPFGTYNSLTDEGMRPIAIDATINSVYVLKKLNGRQAVYRVKLDGSMATELAFAHDRVDVDNIVRSRRGGKVIGVTFVEDKRRTVYFDPAYDRLGKSLSKAIPNLPLIQFEGASVDESRLLLFAGSDSDPGRYYVYDKNARKLEEVLPVRPQLAGVKLATVKPVSYPAGDGTQVPGYLTLPASGAGKNLPAIVLPHGGPSARDEWGFDWLSQYLASQGYAVLQPNYRGSTGYGDAWLMENGFKSWRTSIGDVTAGAKWLASQGIADPKRLAIVGWSYGGYAALQAGATEPGLFKAIVAIAPVTDLSMLKAQYDGFTSAKLARAFVGSGPHIEQGSPARNAGSIAAPVLMFHGDRDFNVAVGHAKYMDQELRRAGKKSELVLYPKLEHDLNDAAARTVMLEKIEAFLGQNLK